MIAAAFGFSLIASLLVAVVGRRDALRAPRLTATVILLLLAFPFLSLLPKLAVLPPTDSPTGEGNPLLTALWLVGGMLCAARPLLAMGELRRWHQQSRFLRTVPLSARRRAQVRELDRLDGPVAAGIFRPTIFVPRAWNQWSPETQRGVLAHELAHLRRNDPLWRWLGAIACAVHWFNPFAWWLVRRHALQAEFACDAQVLRSGIAARHYATLLCEIASSARTPHGAVAMAEKSQLHRRVERLFQPPGLISPLFCGVLIAAVGAIALALSVVRPAAPSGAVRISVEEVRLRLQADPFPGD